MRRTALLLLLGLAAFAGHAAQVQVAAAANLAGTVQKIADAFRRDTGHQAVIATGSTGKFHAQIRNGAPFEVLLAADDETPRRLEAEGLARPGTRFTYAIGQLVLWSAQPGLVNEHADVLRQPPRGMLAIADPRVAPYGAAAVETLRKLGLHAQWERHLAVGESIGQAWQFVASGNAPIGFVALSQVVAPPPNPPAGGEGYRIARGSGWIVPAHLHAPIRQDAVLLNPGASNPAATAFLAYLRGDTARALLRAAGYTF